METAKWVKLPATADAFLATMAKKHDYGDGEEDWETEGITPDILKKLRANPVTRISYAWMRLCEGEGGLSPFAIAGVAKISPKRVLTQASKEPYMATIDLCVITQLPIVFPNDLAPTYLATWGRNRAPLLNKFNEAILNYGGNHGLNLEEHSFECFMEKYGGVDWQKHCTRQFDPMKKNCKISLKHWKILREFYLGRKLQR